MQQKTSAFFLLILLLGLFPPAAAYGENHENLQEFVQQKLAGLPAFMERGMADYGIPGMAVAVVMEGELVYAKGFGERKLGSGEAVDERTVFGMASLTKAMTTAAIAMLVDEGKMAWDDRVRDHLPWFTLSDPWVSEHITVRDLLSHRVGIGRLTGNRLRFMPGRDPETIMDFVRHMPFEQTFRAGYVYSNIMYMVAGQIIEAVSGSSWDDFMSERLFLPLQMTTASTSINQLDNLDNAAWPHQEIFGEVVVIPRRNFDNVGPAASVNASVTDMARWMLLHLGEPGTYNGQQLISKENILETHQPHQVFPIDDPLRDPLTGYGLGWGLREYKGYRVSQHSGATDGMTSFLLLMPEKDLGIIVASNLYCSFRPAVIYTILDAILETEEAKDWHAYYFDQFTTLKTETLESRQAIEDQRQSGTSPSLPLEAYAGHFHHQVYDNAEIRLHEDGHLVMQLWNDEEMIADLEHWHFDTFRAHWRNRSMREKFVTFDLDSLGTVKQLNVQFTLRQILISAGIYPSDYYRIVPYRKVDSKE